MSTRTEKDLLGSKQIPDEKYWGIHTFRALENFPFSGLKVPQSLITSMAEVKLAAARANHELGYLEQNQFKAIEQACIKIIDGDLQDEFPLPALQGGAGTSLNMNLNEVIANRALEIYGKQKGEYHFINPIEDINLHQSTNDVYPTALKIAVIKNLQILAGQITHLQGTLQKKEQDFSGILTLARTQMQNAAPITLGAQFASFAEAIGRDRWRIFKSEERLRTVNIGGTAVGTGLTAPRDYIFLVIEKLREITKLGLSRADHVMDQTANTDCFVEVYGMLNANAINLQKISSDLRIMHYLQEITLSKKQAGSSIMPGKVNPVILEAVISAALKVENDSHLISRLSASGTFQINEFLPLMGDTILNALKLLETSNEILANHINEITTNKEALEEKVFTNSILITAFLPFVGYEKAETILKQYNENNTNISFKNFLINELGEELVNKILSSHNLISLGFKTDGKNT